MNREKTYIPCNKHQNESTRVDTYQSDISILIHKMLILMIHNTCIYSRESHNCITTKCKVKYIYNLLDIYFF